MANIQIIVGSVMGTALEVAETVKQTLEGMGHSIRINPQFVAGQLTDTDDEVFIVCTSNTGMGDLPANIAPLHAHLTNDFPNIAGKQFGLINLGDSSYPNFAQAGQTLENALVDIGAQRLGDPLVLDAIYVSDYDDEAQDWALAWGQLL